MFERLLAPLLETLRPYFDLSETRLETLAVLLFGLANCRTVNLSHLANQFPGDARHASNYRRLRRFFQHIRLDGDTAARLIVGMLKLGRPKLLALDRTNWKLGSRDVNAALLAIAIVARTNGAPMATHAPVPGAVDVDAAPHAGNSDTAQRIALLERYRSLFGASSIRALLADRAFIGAEWLKFLCENNVPFAIRLRENMQIQIPDGRRFQFRTLLRNRRRGTWEGWLNGMDSGRANQLRIAAKRIKGSELRIKATNLEEGVSGLNLYRKRWGIECLFADAKTRGLNIEDTHITDPDKLATLLVVVALAVTWAYRCGTRTMGRTAIPRKAHRRYEKSWFRTGLDTLRNWIIHQPGQALDAWVSTCPRRPFQPARSS